MLRKVGRLFTIKTRWEAWFVIYAIALGAVERGQHYLHSYPGFGGWLFRVLGFTGREPRIPTMVELREIKDKDALRGQLERWARIPGLNRIIVSHGKIVTRDAPAVLDRLAESLAA